MVDDVEVASDEAYNEAEDAYVPNVISIFDRAPVDQTVEEIQAGSDREYAVAMLNSILERIESGCCVGFCIIVGETALDSNAITGVSIAASLEVSENPFVFMGGLERLKYRINSDMDGHAEMDQDDAD